VHCAVLSTELRAVQAVRLRLCCITPHTLLPEGIVTIFLFRRILNRPAALEQLSIPLMYIFQK
jgi:hypothetical protein